MNIPETLTNPTWAQCILPFLIQIHPKDAPLQRAPWQFRPGLITDLY